jgi:choline dehydrogenase-like flavoprotein
MAAYFSSFALSDSNAKLRRFGNTLIPTIIFGKRDNKSMRESSKHLMDLLGSGGATELWPKKGISPVTTVHLFGSMPIGSSTLINDKGRLITESRIRISDGSLMPQAPWGNPQGAIMVLCELMAKRAHHE